jgi:hypothetical protein
MQPGGVPAAPTQLAMSSKPIIAARTVGKFNPITQDLHLITGQELDEFINMETDQERLDRLEHWNLHSSIPGMLQATKTGGTDGK